MATVISLSDEMAKKASILAERLGISLDELYTMALQELLEKYSHSSDADLDFEQKMKVAKGGMKKYRNALIELAK